MSDSIVFIRLTSSVQYKNNIWVSAAEISDVHNDVQNERGVTWLGLKSGTGFYVTESPEEVLQKMGDAIYHAAEFPEDLDFEPQDLDT